MPNLSTFHPQIVHFVVVLLVLGVALRCLSIVVRRPFVNYAAALCLVFGTVAAALAVKSGNDAHGPVERIPGVREAVIEHEEHGILARNIFFGVAALELLALGLAARPDVTRYARWAHVGSAVVGLVAAVQLYEAAEHGGELVYSYAGGPGLRTGDPKDVERLLIAGLYNQSREDRRAGHLAEAGALVDELVRRMPTDPEARLLRVESLLLDHKNYALALAAVDSIAIDSSDVRLRARQAMLKTDAYIGQGKPDSARVVLAGAAAAMPQNARLKARLDSLRPSGKRR
jgi:uncharacterized membrane protein